MLIKHIVELSFFNPGTINAKYIIYVLGNMPAI
jgi:hypothetical protein